MPIDEQHVEKGKDPGVDLGKQTETPDNFEIIVGPSYRLREVPAVNGPVLVELALPLMAELVEYAVGDLRHEQGGFLLGRCREANGQVVVEVTAWVEAKYATHRQASLTFTHRDWEYLANEQERLYPALQVVGWFHTHPGFGVFLSAYDLFIHRYFFSSPEQVALVIDPVRKKAGVFVWRKDEVVEGAFRIDSGERRIKEKVGAASGKEEERRLAEDGSAGDAGRKEVEMEKPTMTGEKGPDPEPDVTGEKEKEG